MPTFTREMNQRGQIADKSYASLKLPQDNESDAHNKDNVSISRRRACLLTHTSFVDEIVAIADKKAREEERLEDLRFERACKQHSKWHQTNQAEAAELMIKYNMHVRREDVEES